MRMSGRLWAALLPVLLAAQLVGAADQPPTVHQVGDRWSAWDPPADVAEGARIYEVQNGDTLWDLAAEFLGDPYLWPQIWERNSFIKDSHWIYPGDPLVLDVSSMTIAEVGALPSDGGRTGGAGAGDPSAEMAEESEDARLRLDDSVYPPEALGSEDDVYCAGFIGDSDLEFERRIIGSEYENLAPRLSLNNGSVKGQWGTVDTVKMGLSTGDIVYLDGGAEAGLSPGLVFTAVTPREEVRHPRSGEDLGRFYKYSGRVRLLSVQDQTAIGEIVHSCEQIFVGATLQPFVDQPIPLARRPYMRGVNDPRSDSLADGPIIVRSSANLVSLGQGHVVFLDRGSDHDVAPGDIYTIYRLNDPGLPPVVIGELGVLSVEARSSTAKILESRHTVHVGDYLDLEVY